MKKGKERKKKIEEDTDNYLDYFEQLGGRMRAATPEDAEAREVRGEEDHL